MSYAFPPPPTPSLSIEGHQDRFPIHRIYCVGRNYVDHALEMGGDPDREPPFFFSKPADAIVESGEDVPYPSATENLHYEMELVLAIGNSGKVTDPSEADDFIYGFAAGVDLTRRDLQANAKKQGRPWDSAKGFDHSAPCGSITPASAIDDISGASLCLKVDGLRKQQARISDMIWSPREIIAHLSSLYTLQAGDLIFTGTPAGVGPLISGNHVVGEISGLSPVKFSIR